VVFAHPALAAAEPTLHDIYVAADAGKLGEAQAMIDKVLRDHPNSAKAHYVAAELLVKQGLMRKAEAELATAERLAPGLPFAKADAVSTLRSHIAAPAARTSARPVALPDQNFDSASSGMPWGLLLAGGALIAFVVFAMRFMARRSAANAAMASYPAGYPSYGGGAVMQPGMGGMSPGMSPGMGAPAAGGMGSGIMGGLATGAALGAGMVAGQALMHHFTDADGNRAAAPSPDHNNPAPQPDYNMGGQDFGVADAGSSWDDGGGSDGGGGDWN
jgi:hypothetical protein